MFSAPAGRHLCRRGHRRSICIARRCYKDAALRLALRNPAAAMFWRRHRWSGEQSPRCSHHFRLFHHRFNFWNARSQKRTDHHRRCSRAAVQIASDKHLRWRRRVWLRRAGCRRRTNSEAASFIVPRSSFFGLWAGASERIYHHLSPAHSPKFIVPVLRPTRRNSAIAAPPAPPAARQSTCPCRRSPPKRRGRPKPRLRPIRSGPIRSRR